MISVEKPGENRMAKIGLFDKSGIVNRSAGWLVAGADGRGVVKTWVRQNS